MMTARLGLFTGLLMLVPMLTAHGQSEAGRYLTDMVDLLEEAHAASTAAESAETIETVKAQADVVFGYIWGQASGLVDAESGAVATHGWKTRWQTDGSEFDENHAALHGTTPPQVGDPEQLGLMGRGRAVIVALASQDTDSPHTDHVMASLSNVIGWMRLDDGVTKGERQPRIDLTHVWDAPSRFWNTTADTGWLGAVFAQAVNILKTDYGSDLTMAREHAAAMTQLIEKCRDGMDENGDGSIAPAMMEGGLNTAVQHAQYLGLINQ